MKRLAIEKPERSREGGLDTRTIALYSASVLQNTPSKNQSLLLRWNVGFLLQDLLEFLHSDCGVKLHNQFLTLRSLDVHGNLPFVHVLLREFLL